MSLKPSGLLVYDITLAPSASVVIDPFVNPDGSGDTIRPGVNAAGNTKGIVWFQGRTQVAPPNVVIVPGLPVIVNGQIDSFPHTITNQDAGNSISGVVAFLLAHRENWAL